MVNCWCRNKKTPPEKVFSAPSVISPSSISVKSTKPAPNVFSGWNFADFVEGPGNAFALAAAKSVSKAPSHQNNPLFIYGPTGLGKTHLLLAIGNAQKTQKRLLYLPAERFFNDCILHIQKNAMFHFREKYRRKLDLLLLDDVQILGRGESTQEEFFHTFECLIQHGCQIVLASDQKPQHIKGLKERLQTRFSGGLMVDITPPDRETTLAILQKKAIKWGLSLSEEMFFYLAGLPATSVREREGFLNKIKIFSELRESPISLDILKKLFADHDTYRALSSEYIARATARHFGLQTKDIFSPSRKRTIVQARNICLFLIRKHLKLSFHQIGDFLGKDHSSILKAWQKMQAGEKKSAEIFQQLKQVEKSLRA